MPKLSRWERQSQKTGILARRVNSALKTHTLPDIPTPPNGVIAQYVPSRLYTQEDVHEFYEINSFPGPVTGYWTTSTGIRPQITIELEPEPELDIYYLPQQRQIRLYV